MLYSTILKAQEHTRNVQMVFKIKMSRISLLFPVFQAVLFLSGNAEASDIRETNERFITWTYKETPMGLYLPQQKNTPLPVVMFLHGCHNNPVSSSHWIISALNAVEPCAVFLPTAPETENSQYSCADWGGTYDSDLRPQMINALHELDSLTGHYGFDTTRRYVYGESMGGEGVYRLLMDFPQRFAGAVSAAGYTPDKGAEAMAKTPLWIVIGSEDEMSPVEESRTIYNSILGAGGSMVKYTEYPDLSHVGGIEKAREDPEILKWLLAQKRSTGIIRHSGSRGENVLDPVTVSYRDGNPYFPSSLPHGTAITLFDIKGRQLIRTDAQRRFVKHPVCIDSRIVLWNVSNSRFTASGKISLFKGK